jgi:hypothetical protein
VVGREPKDVSPTLNRKFSPDPPREARKGIGVTDR